MSRNFEFVYRGVVGCDGVVRGVVLGEVVDVDHHIVVVVVVLQYVEVV